MPEILFSEAEWDAAMPRVVAEMSDYLKPYRTPLLVDAGDHAVGGGTGSYLELGGRTFILTNAHVAAIREGTRRLVHQLAGVENFANVIGDHSKFEYPLDLALLPVDTRAWDGLSHGSRAISLDQIAWAHSPVPTELMTFVGFPGDDVGFHFDSVTLKAKCLTGREVLLPPEDDRFSPRFHFGLDYKPDLAVDVIAKEGLSRPPGLSGSTVWNTCFVEAKMAGTPWTPELAKVTGVVWGWPSNVGCLVATRAEYLRSFLLDLLQRETAMAGRSGTLPPASEPSD
jgi:hypothetical protein